MLSGLHAAPNDRRTLPRYTGSCLPCGRCVNACVTDSTIIVKRATCLGVR